MSPVDLQPSSACKPVSLKYININIFSVWLYVNILNTLQPPQVELVEGYGVYLSKQQLDEAVDQSCNSASRLMRNLLVVFFSPSVLAL